MVCWSIMCMKWWLDPSFEAYNMAMLNSVPTSTWVPGTAPGSLGKHCRILELSWVDWLLWLPPTPEQHWQWTPQNSSKQKAPLVHLISVLHMFSGVHDSILSHSSGALFNLLLHYIPLMQSKHLSRKSPQKILLCLLYVLAIGKFAFNGGELHWHGEMKWMELESYSDRCSHFAVPMIFSASLDRICTTTIM